MTTPIFTITSRAILSNAPTDLLAVLRRELTEANPKYTNAKKYGRWIGKKLQPVIKFYEENDGGFTFPRGFARQAITHCRELTGETPQIVDLRSSLKPITLDFKGTLREYQQKAIADLLQRDFGVLEAGTGSGKTVIALGVIAQRRQPTLILVHTKELLYQWRDRITEFLGIEAGLIGDGHLSVLPVTVAIVNSARGQAAALASRFGQICVDECHRVPSTLFTDVVTLFDCRYALGLSATAFRSDGLTRLINFYLGDLAHRVSANTLHTSGAVLRPRYVQHATEFSYGYRGNYAALLKSLTINDARNQLIANHVATAADKRPGTVLVVSDRINHCEILADLLHEHHIEAQILTGQTASDKRTELVAGIREGSVKVVISTVQLIGEGFDCPGLATLFLATPIKFSGRLLQVVGRILRPDIDKHPEVHDYIDPVSVLKASAKSRLQVFSTFSHPETISAQTL